MATFALIHGGGSRGSTFDLLAEQLRALGHEVVAPDLPIDQPDGDLTECARSVAMALGDVNDLVVVGHSFGGLVAPIVADLVDARLIVLMSAMVPAPGETFGEWWTASGWSAATEGADLTDELATYYQDMLEDLASEDLARSRDHGSASTNEPWPLDAWPAVPTRYIAFADDRLMPLEFQRRLARERIGIDADEMPGSHMAYLSHPAELAARLDDYWQVIAEA